MLAPSRPRHIGIQLAAALMFACTVMNLAFFIKLIDELWTAGHHHARRQIDTQSVMVSAARVDGEFLFGMVYMRYSNGTFAMIETVAEFASSYLDNSSDLESEPDLI
jgi:hypothetical protein